MNRMLLMSFASENRSIQEIADKLWPKFASILPGEKDEVHVRSG